MHLRSWILITFALSGHALTVPVSGHQGAINVFVDAPTDQVFVLENFQLPQLVEFLGIEISTDGPGLGVNFPTNGVLPDTAFSVDIAQDLLYWDGFGLAPTFVNFEFGAPPFDNQGVVNTSPVMAYNVTQNSGYQSGMTWGTYNGVQFWEAHALNFLTPLSAPPGIYGVTIKILADQHVDAEPFVIPFVYDPDSQWDPLQEEAGASRLREAAAAHRIADLNVDGHVRTDDVDSLVAEIVAGTNSPAFDLTSDGIVDHSDLSEWLLQAGTAKLSLASAFLPGDANLDGAVDGQDFIDWNNNKFTSVAAWSAGDFNADGFVDGQDFIIWNDFKFTSSAAAGVTAVPEPANLWVGLLLCLPLFLKHSFTWNM